MNRVPPLLIMALPRQILVMRFSIWREHNFPHGLPLPVGRSLELVVHQGLSRLQAALRETAATAVSRNLFSCLARRALVSRSVNRA